MNVWIIVHVQILVKNHKTIKQIIEMILIHTLLGWLMDRNDWLVLFAKKIWK